MARPSALRKLRDGVEAAKADFRDGDTTSGLSLDGALAYDRVYTNLERRAAASPRLLQAA